MTKPANIRSSSDSLPSNPHVLTSLPVLILYPHSRCNCRCIMCDIWKVTTSQEISAADLETHVADIKALQVEWVVFSGGEPLMHSDLFQLTAVLRDCGIRTTLLTTGLLLARHAENIVRSMDDVIVSLDGHPELHDRIRRVPGAFTQVSVGTAALRYQAPGYPVSARCTVQRANHNQLRRIVDTARGLQLDSISFLAADVTSTAFNRPDGWTPSQQEPVALTIAETEALAEEIEALVRDNQADIASGFIREDAQKLRRLAQHFRAQLGLEQAQAPRCNAPWISAVIESDGTVRPCFFHNPIGKILPGGLAGVINSPAGVSFRTSLDVGTDPICRNCVCSLYRPR